MRLPRHVPLALTTPLAAHRFGPPAVGLAPWASHQFMAPQGGRLRVTAVPAQHGPDGCEPEYRTGPRARRHRRRAGHVVRQWRNASPDVIGLVARRLPSIDLACCSRATRTALLNGAHLTPTSEQADARPSAPVRIPACAFPAPA